MLLYIVYAMLFVDSVDIYRENVWGYLFISLHAACINSVDIPWILQNLLFHIPIFGRKVFFIFLTIDLIVEMKLICIIGLSDLINPLILPTSTLDDIFTHFGGFFSIFMGQLALKFH